MLEKATPKKISGKCHTYKVKELSDKSSIDPTMPLLILCGTTWSWYAFKPDTREMRMEKDKPIAISAAKLDSAKLDLEYIIQAKQARIDAVIRIILNWQSNSLDFLANGSDMTYAPTPSNQMEK
jgi:hypothetical protein